MYIYMYLLYVYIYICIYIYVSIVCIYIYVCDSLQCSSSSFLSELFWHLWLGRPRPATRCHPYDGCTIHLTHVACSEDKSKIWVR